MRIHNSLVGLAIALGGGILAASKLETNEELKKTLKEKNQKMIDDTKEWAKAFGEVAKDTAHVVCEESKKIMEDAKAKIKEYEEQEKEEADANEVDNSDNSEANNNDVAGTPVAE